MLNKIIQIAKSRFFEYFLLSIILILGIVVRLYKIDNPIADWHSWRQADTASVTRIYVADGINLLYPRYHDVSSIQTGIFNPQGYRFVELPIYNALHAVLFKTFPTFTLEVWGRLLTVFCAITTAFFLYLIGKRVIGKAGGLLSAFFYLLIPFNIYFTRVILPDPMGVMFGVISIWAFLEFCEREKYFLFIVSSIFMALTLLIKPYFGFYLFPIVYLAVRKFGLKRMLSDKKLILSAVVFVLISFVPFFIWRLWEGRYPEGIPFYTWAFNGNLIRFKPSFWYWIFGERLGHLILGSFGLVPFVFGLINTKIKNFFIHSFLVGSLAYVVVVASANVMHDYYQIPIIPVVALTLSAGVLFLWTGTVFNKVLARVLAIFSILVMLITGWNQIVGNYNINHPEIIEAGREVDKITPKDALIVAPYDGDTAFLYQTKRSGWPAIDNSIDNIIEEGADFYVSVNLGSPDTKMFEARFKTVEKTNRFIILDLHQEIKPK